MLLHFFFIFCTMKLVFRLFARTLISSHHLPGWRSALPWPNGKQMSSALSGLWSWQEEQWLGVPLSHWLQVQKLLQDCVDTFSFKTSFFFYNKSFKEKKGLVNFDLFVITHKLCGVNLKRKTWRKHDIHPSVI